jgi:hypothetical protein
MAIDWDRVAKQHVVQACHLLDSGEARPTRPAQSTFLIVNGKRYPAKFVRGLAYRLATGRELRSDEYSGGEETVRFFRSLGMTTAHVREPSVEREGSAFASCDCPTVAEVLMGGGEDDELTPDGPVDTLGSDARIADDPSDATTIDADRQIVRKYLGMPGTRWFWEDMVRDLLGTERRRTVNAVGDRVRKTWKKYRLNQFSAEEIDELVRFIRTEAQSVPPPAEPDDPPIVLPETNYTAEVMKRLHAEPDIQKVALVSHDYNKSDANGLWDYSTHVRRIIEACDQRGCDTVLFALYTWDVRSPVPRSHEAMFSGLKHVRRIVMEFGDLSSHSDEPGLEDLAVEMWLRASQSPVIHRQRFATSEEAAAGAGRLVRELEGRLMGSALVMICGESQVISEKRAGGFSALFLSSIGWL